MDNNRRRNDKLVLLECTHDAKIDSLNNVTVDQQSYTLDVSAKDHYLIEFATPVGTLAKFNEYRKRNAVAQFLRFVITLITGDTGCAITKAYVTGNIGWNINAAVYDEHITNPQAEQFNIGCYVTEALYPEVKNYFQLSGKSGTVDQFILAGVEQLVFEIEFSNFFGWDDDIIIQGKAAVQHHRATYAAYLMEIDTQEVGAL